MFSDDCEMAYGEQAALIGILDLVAPRLALEIGTYRGGSLALVAPRAEAVHTFDLVSHISEKLPNVTYHLGDSSDTVPRVLGELAASGRSVDFVFVDGDHARQGVAADVANVLGSAAVSRTVILLHDVANEDVRAGVRDAGLDRSKVAYVNLSLVPPWERSGPFAETWGALGMIVVDESGTLWPGEHRRDANVAWPSALSRSAPWHVARPLRAARRRVQYRLRPVVRRLRGTRGTILGHESEDGG